MAMSLDTLYNLALQKTRIYHGFRNRKAVTAPLIMTSLFSLETILSFVIVLATIPIFRRFAPKLGLVDHPGGRKKHAAPVPLVGGVSIFTALMAYCYFFNVANEYLGLCLGSCLLFVVGLIDDRFDLRASTRFVLQGLIVAVALAIDDVWLTSLGAVGSYDLSIGVFAYPLTVIAILGVTNAINMLDGLDGLSSGILLLILFFIVGFAGLGNQEVLALSSVVFGAVFGFWLCNYRFPWREKASVFMGDSGTTMLGFILPYLAITLTKNSSTAALSPALLLWFFALPLWDISAVILKRLKDGKSPFQAGRDHIHHTLLNHGFNVRQSVLFIYGVSALALSVGTSLAYFQFGTLLLYLSFGFALYMYIERLFKFEAQLKAEVIRLHEVDKTGIAIPRYISKVE